MKIKMIMALILLGLVSVITSHGVYAACGDPSQGLNGGIACSTSPITVESGITRAVNILLFVTGVSAVIVIVVGGMRYVFSGGDPKNTAGAKDTILYAVIGLVVSLLAYAIVNFVIARFI